MLPIHVTCIILGPYHFFDIGNSVLNILKQSLGEMILCMISLPMFLFATMLMNENLKHSSSGPSLFNLCPFFFFFDHCGIMLLKKMVAGNYIIALAFIFIVLEDIF